MGSKFVCRSCLNEISYQYIALESSLNGSTVLEVFNHCTRLDANLNDDFPKNICLPCGRSLQSAYDFIKAANESDLILRGNFEAAEGTASNDKSKQDDLSLKAPVPDEPGKKTKKKSLLGEYEEDY